MSQFSTPVVRIDAIEAHPNADAIEIAVVGGYRCIVRKGQFLAQTPAVYISEQSVVPEGILRRIGLWDEAAGKGRLAGARGNRVKAVRLRGELSQGLLLPVVADRVQDAAGEMIEVAVGDDLSDRLGITKYEPPIPVHLQGEVYNAGLGRTIMFDVDSWQKYPDVLVPGEPVIYTEKLHGTFCGLSWTPEDHLDGFGAGGRITVFSKGLGARGLAYKNNAANEHNLYVRATMGVIDAIDAMDHDAGPLLVLGEVTGRGVQDLAYDGAVRFRAFAAVRRSEDGDRYINWSELQIRCRMAGIETVPVLGRADFSVDEMRRLASGRSTLADCLREGVVVVPERERRHPEIGRVALKYVSPEYLTRRGGSEYN